jgi:predicted MFS family arabinose efflux permease
VSPAVLIVGAAAAGVAVGLGGPAWNALVAESVPREQVAEAVTLNAVAFNIARAVGPAIGGLVLAWAGGAGCFYANTATFALVIAAVFRLELHEKPTSSVPQPSMLRAFAEPFAQARRDAGIRSVLVSMVVFTFGASFVYVLAPALAKLTLAAGPRSYGLVIGALGVGAVLGATVLKRLRKRFRPAPLLATLMVVYGASAIALSQAPTVPIAILCCVPGGVGWTGTFSSLSALIQIWTDNRLRARAMALYTMTHLATWAIGSSVSGALSEAWSIRDAILIGGIACVVAAAITWRLPLPPSFVSDK